MMDSILNASNIHDFEKKFKEKNELDCVLSRCRKYPTLNVLLTYHRSQGYKVIESFALGTSLNCLSYLYSHSYEVGQPNISRKMSLNLFIALVANTGYEKTGYLRDCRRETVETINQAVRDKYEINPNAFTTYLPSSSQGLQKLCGEMPVRNFIADEVKEFAKAKAPSPKYDVFEAIRNMYDKHIFGLSVTKKAENDNKATDDCFANLLIAGTTDDMKKYLLSTEKILDGTANRFLMIGPSSTRTGSKKPVRVDKKFLEECCFKFLRDKATEHIEYEIDASIATVGLVTERVAKRIAREVYNQDIDHYFQVIAEKNDALLDEYDEKGIEVEPRIIMLTRQSVMKMRIAYLLWIDKGFPVKDAMQCAQDANDIVDALNKTTEHLYENTRGTPEMLRTKIMALKEKNPDRQKIYLSKLIQKKGYLDSNVYGNILNELTLYLRTLYSVNQIQIVERNKKIIAFYFCEELE